MQRGVAGVELLHRITPRHFQFLSNHVHLTELKKHLLLSAFKVVRLFSFAFSIPPGSSFFSTASVFEVEHHLAFVSFHFLPGSLVHFR